MSPLDWINQPRGWYWLRRKRDGAVRVAFHDRLGGYWRLSDGIGRTRLVGADRLHRLFDFLSGIPTPADPLDADA